ncbi:MAG: hypothetical protein QGI68_06065 [Pseudomonadales bacterium]|nr:hypothetical protein [Pseudomonadales bacterium]MDP7358532.1 hypothetical protein [Pseudomonadales bacterium]MDP7595119.1 hypothetical protein [Pseudomonadales bacterium]HJN48877.1 hypothetical protein [Pseudomonadales bacterium]|tara:strand:- start:2188 stop:2847 length:660 start_codon:yes stop_codon:yes gene_type:complete
MISSRCLIAICGALLMVHSNAEDVADAVDAPRVTRDRNEVIDEIVTEGVRPNIRIDPVQMGRIRNDNGRGARLYRQRRYAEAFPYLLAAAERGFKLAQARVSYLYQLGLGVERDSDAAVGWLGVAASRITSPEIRTYYKNFINHIPRERMPEVNAIVQDYTARYGSNAVGLFCSNTRWAGTHISRLKCDFKDEYNFRDVLDDESITAGVATTGGTNGEE